MALDLSDPFFHSDFVGRSIVRPFCFFGDVPAIKPGIVFSFWITRSRFSGHDPGSVRPLFWVSKVYFVVLGFSQCCIFISFPYPLSCPPIPFLVLALSRLLPPMQIAILYWPTFRFLWLRLLDGDSGFVAAFDDVRLRVDCPVVSCWMGSGARIRPLSMTSCAFVPFRSWAAAESTLVPLSSLAHRRGLGANVFRVGCWFSLVLRGLDRLFIKFLAPGSSWGDSEGCGFLLKNLVFYFRPPFPMLVCLPLFLWPYFCHRSSEVNGFSVKKWPFSSFIKPVFL